MEANYVRSILSELVERYGNKVLLVLETAIEIAKRNRILGKCDKGDFDYRTLVEELNKKGFSYNPSQLLRILEREYNLIVTTYHSTNQHWYKFKDLEAVEQCLKSLRGVTSIDDPVIAMLRIQVKSLQPKRLLEFLKKLSMKSKLSERDIEKFQRFSFEVLPKIVKVLKLAEEYEDELATEISILKTIIELAYTVAERIGSVESSTQLVDDIEFEFEELSVFSKSRI